MVRSQFNINEKINYSIFDKLSQLNQREIVENKRLGSVLAHIQQQHEELKQQNKQNLFQVIPCIRALQFNNEIWILCLNWNVGIGHFY